MAEIRYSTAAQKEYSEVLERYYEINPDLSGQFAVQVERIEKLLELFPELYPCHEDYEGIYWITQIQGFPY